MRKEGVGGRKEGAEGGRKEGAVRRKEGAGKRKEGAGKRKEGAGKRKECAGGRKEGAGGRKEGAGGRKEVAGRWGGREVGMGVGSKDGRRAGREKQGVAKSGKRPTLLSSGYANFLSMKLLGLLLLPQDGMLVNCKKKEIIIMVTLMYSVMLECNLFLTFFHVLLFFFLDTEGSTHGQSHLPAGFGIHPMII